MQQQAQMCVVCKRFYGNPTTSNMCSACYRDSLQKALGGLQKPAASSVLATSPPAPAKKEEELKSKAEQAQKPKQVSLMHRKYRRWTQ